MDMTFNVMRQGGADDDMIQALREEIETVMRSSNPMGDFESQLDKFSGHPGWANVAGNVGGWDTVLPGTGLPNGPSSGGQNGGFGELK